MLNYLALNGKLEYDPEMHYLGDKYDQPEVRFSLVFPVGHNRTGRIEVSCFNRLAELVGRFLRRAAHVAVSGALDQQHGQTAEERQCHGFRLLARSLELNETDSWGNTRKTPLDGHLPGPRLSGAKPQDNGSKGGD